MRIFLTGGTGFVGSHFLKEALNSGDEIYALRRSKNKICKIAIPKEPIWVNSELDKINFKEMPKFDALIHLASHSANYPYDNLENCLYQNLTVPLRMLNLAFEAGIDKFLITGSCFEYGLSGINFDKIPANAPLIPTQTYPASKAASSIAFIQFAKERKVGLSLLRLFQIYGEGELYSRLYPSLRRSAHSGENFKMTKGGQIRDFMDVKLLAKKLFLELKNLIIEEKKIIKVQNIGSGKPMSILDFSKKVWIQEKAKGILIPGAIPYRKNEVMRYTPCLEPFLI